MIRRTKPEQAGRSRVARLFGSPRAPQDPMDGLLDGESFRQLLARERVNTDRGRTSFATLVFSWPDATSEEDVASVVRTIQARIRDTDVLGWIRRRQVGLMLLSADAEDALEIAEDLYARFEQGVSQPECTVYPYPPLAECA